MSPARPASPAARVAQNQKSLASEAALVVWHGTDQAMVGLMPGHLKTGTVASSWPELHPAKSGGLAFAAPCARAEESDVPAQKRPTNMRPASRRCDAIF